MSDERDPSTGFRVAPAPGPGLRTDVIDAYVFRRAVSANAESPEFLLLRRAGRPLAGTWQPVMGHIESGETAVQTAARELREEIALDVTDAGACVGFWQLEQVYPFFLAEIDAVVCSPRFAVEVTPAWSPTLNDEHEDWKWIRERTDFLWPGQRLALDEIVECLLPREAPTRTALAVRP
ncbi:MAG: NUDIX domain-containing protein [Planctomycetota bacterium]